MAPIASVTDGSRYFYFVIASKQPFCVLEEKGLMAQRKILEPAGELPNVVLH